MERLLHSEVKFKGATLKIARAKQIVVKAKPSVYVEGATKIFVGAVPLNATLEEFRQYFTRYGPIEELSLPLKNKYKNVNKGHGFVTFKYPQSAKAVIADFKHHFMRAKWVS